ncbi:MAG: dTDP-4-dehydrorhamnose 3,5-epimerase family protein [Gammaproteobacteria bacterium]
MKLLRTNIHDVCIIESFHAVDDRGYFTKTFNKEFYKQLGINAKVSEVFFSSSKKNVIRGMHYQCPPYDTTKIISVIKGSIIDVVLDIRRGSPSFGSYVEIGLTEMDHRSLYVPSGFAHGFLSLQNDTMVCYLQSRGYQAAADEGIHYASFGKEWSIHSPTISVKDNQLPNLYDIQSPFIYLEGEN